MNELFPLLMAAVETTVMAGFVCWGWRKVTYYMSFVRDGRHMRTPLIDALGVCAITAGAFYHAAYNVASWLAPRYITAAFGPLDSFFLVLFYIGCAEWVLLPMWRRR
jgi:hypothetical protein